MSAVHCDPGQLTRAALRLVASASPSYELRPNARAMDVDAEKLHELWLRALGRGVQTRGVQRGDDHMLSSTAPSPVGPGFAKDRQGLRGVRSAKLPDRLVSHAHVKSR